MAHFLDGETDAEYVPSADVGAENTDPHPELDEDTQEPEDNEPHGAEGGDEDESPLDYIGSQYESDYEGSQYNEEVQRRVGYVR